MRRQIMHVLMSGLAVAGGAPVWAGSTERVSVTTRGAQADGDSFVPAISADGRYVAFTSTATNLVSNDTNGLQDVFVRDRRKQRTERVSVTATGAQANNARNSVVISADGRYVAFVSFATNLVPNDTNFVPDIFVRDR